MIAYRRADVAELNTVARTLLDREGRLGRDRLRLDNGIELAAGDRILCTRNDRRLEVANGSRGTISAVDREQRAIEVELDDHRRLTLPARYLDAGHVAHAYALTGHKTQGLTVERAFVLADDRRALREWGYVALSRAREQTRLYTTANELEPDAPPHRPEPAGPVDRLADALTRPAAETLATDAATSRPDPTERDALARQSRQLIEQRLALEKEHLDTTRRRNQTDRRLAGLGVFGRARHGGALRDEISEHDQKLARLDRELARVDRAAPPDARARARARPRLSRGPSEACSRERALGRALERGLDRGIEL